MGAIAAIALAAGVLVAVLSGGGSPHGRGDSTRASAHRDIVTASRSRAAVAADYLGLTRAQLSSGKTLAQIADATPGKTAKGLLDALVAARLDGHMSASVRARRRGRLRARLEAQLERIPGYGGLPASARYLGISVASLRRALAAGRSLEQIAAATPGRSAQGLIDARVRAGEAALARALASGRLSASTVGRLRSRLRTRIAREVSRTLAR